MPQKLYPSAHILEIFMPFLHDEKRLIEVLQKIAEMDFYRNVELPAFPTKERRDTVRRILRDNDLTAVTYAAPYLNERGMSLCDLNDRRRAETIRYLKKQADFAAECGYMTFGVPSGPYPGDEFHDEAMAVQADALARIADYTALLGMNCSIEPLDRHVHKKALIGPMDEVVSWFKPLRKAHPNLFLHWDSSHEQLGGLGVFNTLDMAAPIRKVSPLVFSTKRLKTRAMSATTMAMVRYSVFMKVFAPLRMMPAISAISAVPSGILRMRT